jgi:O-antigen ligase
VYFSYTRTVWLGTAAGLLVLLAFSLTGRIRLVVMGSILTAGVVVSAANLDDLVGLKRELTANESRHSTQVRASFGYISWKMFLDHPFVGCGFGRFPVEKLPYLSDRSTPLHLEATRPLGHHSTYLSLLTETGAVGLILFLATLGAWVCHAWTLAQNVHMPPWIRGQGRLMLAVLSLYAVQLAFHELTYKPVDNSLIALLAGTTMALVQTVRTGLPSPAPESTLLRRRIPLSPRAT